MRWFFFFNVDSDFFFLFGFYKLTLTFVCFLIFSGSLLLESKINPNTAYQKQQASSCLSLIWKTSSVIKEVLIWQRWESFPDEKKCLVNKVTDHIYFLYRLKVSNWKVKVYVLEIIYYLWIEPLFDIFEYNVFINLI